MPQNDADVTLRELAKEIETADPKPK